MSHLNQINQTKKASPGRELGPVKHSLNCCRREIGDLKNEIENLKDQHQKKIQEMQKNYWIIIQQKNQDFIEKINQKNEKNI